MSLPSKIPGLVLAVALALLATPVSAVLGHGVLAVLGIDATGRAGPISAIPVAVLLGMLVANTLGVHARLEAGLEIAVHRVLRLGVVLIGLKLSFLDVLELGLLGVPVVVTLVALAFAVALGIARWAGVSARLGSLAAASTAICGITATLAVAPSIEADDREVAATVANVTIFGLVAMLTYPYLAHALFADSPGAAGLFLGTAIHDTSQVMGAAMAYRDLFHDPRVLQVATVAKLTRNTLIVAVVPLLGWLHLRQAGAGDTRRFAPFPMFVLGFLALSLVRTVGDLLLPATPGWHDGVHLLGERVASLALATALAAVGLKVRVGVLRELGPRPFAVGLGAAVAVGLASLGLSALVGPYLAS